MITTVKENTNNYDAKDTDYDGLWKNLIEELFQEFMEFFAPDLYPEIDFEKGTDFPNIELFQFVINSKKGRKYSDRLAKVTMKNGAEKYIFVHIEVQAVGKQDFAERMFKYFYRIYDKHKHPIYSIALLTDASHQNYEDTFRYSFYGTELTYLYNVYRFYGKDKEKLKKSDNPFALAVLAGIYVSENSGRTKEDHEKRFQFKQQLISLALEKYSHRDTYLSALLYFIDYILQVPAELQEKLYELLPIAQNEKEEGKIMGMEKLRDTPTFGRLFREIEEEATKKGLEKGIEQGMEKGMEKGIEQGRQEGVEVGKEQGIKQGRVEAERDFATKLLERNYSDEEITQLTSLSLKEVKMLRESYEN
ncbi:Rpn family recombination-promoting nuclease/putative transposase [Oceanobacillus sp. FSL W7-1293]|uniref:Rpn family recombination-promoting nuclease/putative transposase n=1 Tax=Oceanobacillus sp. FSL W7-1293 TaxID=2921699 RepID=UPI0030D5B769